jgi:competence protein ComEA
LEGFSQAKTLMKQGNSHINSAAAWWLSATAAGLMGFSVLTGSARAQEPADDPGAQEFQVVCAKCHPPDRIVTARRTKTQWEETLEKMTKLGAPITDDNYDILLSYLVHHYGKVNINRSVAADIADVIGLTAEEAATIVKYRDENGPFADFDALAKVPGVDPKKLEKNKDAITFS